MKTKKIVSSAVVAALVAAFFVGSFTAFMPSASALDSVNASADLVVGQPDMTSDNSNQGNLNPAANTMAWPNGMWTDGKKLIVAEIENNRVLVFNSIPTGNNASADVVIGQVDMNHYEVNQGGSSPAANTLARPYTVSSDGIRLFVADAGNNRVLIYNTIPTSNNVSADIVIGQADMGGGDENRGGSIGANTLSYPYCVHTDGTKVYIADGHNNRVLIFNSVPTANGANADVVVGQPDMTSGEANRGSSDASSTTLDTPSGVFTWGGKMYITDAYNSRVLVFNGIPTGNNYGANYVVGQASDTGSDSNQGGDPVANTLNVPYHAFTDGKRLYVSDYGNSRVLVYNSLPSSDTNNISADMVIGQPNFSSNTPNQSGDPAANTLYWQGALFYGAGRLYVSDVENNRVLSYSLDAALTWANKRSKNMGSGIKGKLSRTKISFSGKKTMAKKGRVYAYENGVLKKSVKIKKNGKWKLSFSEKQRSVNRLFQFRFLDKSNVVVGVSDQYNYYLTGKASKKTANSINWVSMASGGSVSKSKIGSKFWNLKK